MGKDIIDPLTGDEMFVFGEYWNGIIDVRDRFGRDRVMKITEQKQWLDAMEYKAIRELQWWLKKSDALWSVLEGRDEHVSDYTVTALHESPEGLQAAA